MSNITGKGFHQNIARLQADLGSHKILVEEYQSWKGYLWSPGLIFYLKGQKPIPFNKCSNICMVGNSASHKVQTKSGAGKLHAFPNPLTSGLKNTSYCVEGTMSKSIKEKDTSR